MAFNLSTFRANITSVGRSQYFIVRLPQASSDSDVITALARQTSLPPMTHNVQTVAYRGLDMKLVEKPDFPPWQVTFLCDEAHSLRRVMLSWMERAYNIQTLRNLGHNEYKRDGVSVSQLAADLSLVSTATFYGMFPAGVGEVALNQSGGEPETFTVDFNYDYYLMNDLAGDVVNTDNDVLIGNDGLTVNSLTNVTLNMQAGALVPNVN
jgi:hypothetical protein